MARCGCFATHIFLACCDITKFIQDFVDGQRTLILALVWQMMRFHFLSVLRSLSQRGGQLLGEREIVDWANRTAELRAAAAPITRCGQCMSC